MLNNPDINMNKQNPDPSEDKFQHPGSELLCCGAPEVVAKEYMAEYFAVE